MDIGKQIKVVSFDIFDTLLLRDVDKPTDVFKIIEKENNIPGFYKKRIRAERTAREKNPDSQEVTIEDIYNSYEGISQETLLEYIELEVYTEISLCHPNQDVVPFYEQCKQKYKIVITSDMYFPSDTMERILSSCGITGYDKLYISCDIGKAKYDRGELFTHIATDLKVSTNEIVHVGDDYKADFLCAKKVGVQALKIKRMHDQKLTSGCTLQDCRKINSEQFRYIYNFICNTTPKDADFYYRFGYENVGILLWSFCKWLIGKLNSENVEQVLFIARDGYMIKKVYDVLGYGEQVPSYYFEMSRRSAMIPASFSKGLNYNEMLDVIRLPSCIKAGQLLESWGLDEEKYSIVLDELGIDKNKEYKRSGLIKEQAIKSLYERVKEDVEYNATREYEVFLEYLKSFHFENKTALVDIGWSATIQKELIKTLKEEGITADIRGYYIALDRKTAVNSDDLIAEGFLWDHYNTDNKELEEGAFVGMIETLFHEQAGSVKKYSYDEEGIVVERYPYEYMLLGGNIDEYRTLENIQNGTIAYVESIKDKKFPTDIELNEKQAYRFLRQCFMEPSAELISRFGDIRYFDAGSYTYLAKPKMNLARYVFKPKELLTEFYASEWPIGFLKSVLKVNISYERLWSFLWSIRHVSR